MDGAFALLDFEDPDDPPVAYTETRVGARYVEEPGKVNRYRQMFELIYKSAVTIEEYLS